MLVEVASPKSSRLGAPAGRWGVNSQHASIECKSQLSRPPFAIWEFQARLPTISVLHELDMEQLNTRPSLPCHVHAIATFYGTEMP